MLIHQIGTLPPFHRPSYMVYHIHRFQFLNHLNQIFKWKENKVYEWIIKGNVNNYRSFLFHFLFSLPHLTGEKSQVPLWSHHPIISPIKQLSPHFFPSQPCWEHGLSLGETQFPCPSHMPPPCSNKLPSQGVPHSCLVHSPPTTGSHPCIFGFSLQYLSTGKPALHASHSAVIASQQKTRIQEKYNEILWNLCQNQIHFQTYGLIFIFLLGGSIMIGGPLVIGTTHSIIGHRSPGSEHLPLGTTSPSLPHFIQHSPPLLQTTSPHSSPVKSKV